MGIVGIGGGASVQAADDCEDVGLVVPGFPRELIRELRRFTPLAGVGLTNPIDTCADVYWDPALFAKTIRLVADFDGIDIIFVVLGLIYAAKHGVGLQPGQVEAIAEVSRYVDKPLAVVLGTGNIVAAEELAGEARSRCIEAGVPAFASVRHAARATADVLSYYEVHDR